MAVCQSVFELWAAGKLVEHSHDGRSNLGNCVVVSWSHIDDAVEQSPDDA